MWKLQPLPHEKSHPLFPSNPPLKVEVLSSPLFENKIWLEAHPHPLPLQKAGGVSIMIRRPICGVGAWRGQSVMWELVTNAIQTSIYAFEEIDGKQKIWLNIDVASINVNV